MSSMREIQTTMRHSAMTDDRRAGRFEMPQVWWNGLILTFLLSIAAEVSDQDIYSLIMRILSIILGMFVIVSFILVKFIAHREMSDDRHGDAQ